MKLVEFLTKIADSIRYAEGSPELVPVSEMADRVKARADVERGIIEDKLEGYTNNTATKVRLGALRNMSVLEWVEFGQAISIYSNAFYQSTNLRAAAFGRAGAFGANCFNGCTEFIALVLNGDTAPSLNDSNALANTPIAEGKGWIYIKSDLVEELKTMTNWTVYADQIAAIEDYELKIVIQPTDIVVAVGDKISLETVAMAIGVKYQWQVSADGGNTWSNGSSVTAKKRIYTVTMADYYDGMMLRCIIGDKYGAEVITDAVTVTLAESEVSE